MYSARTERSQSRGKGHLSQEENTRAMQLEVNQLKRKLCDAQRRQASSNPNTSPDGEKDASYRQRSKTPPRESFSYEKELHHKRRHKSPPRKGVGNDAGKTLDQISRSPFTRRIEQAKLPQRFTQPVFTMYNGRTDPVEHVSHFNQRMTVLSKNEALMCKVSPFNLGPVAMRWFNNLKVDSISSFEELTQAFGSRFVTCNRVPWPLSSLLSLSMREGEILKTYSDRW